MGIGDEIMAAAQAKKMYEKHHVPVMIVDRIGRMRTHYMWDGLPYILRGPQAGRYLRLTNGADARPYVAKKLHDRWKWKHFDLEPGEIVLTEEEKKFAAPYAGYILVEPNVKGTNEGNKDWGWDRWLTFTAMLPYQLLQLGPAGTRGLPGIRFVETSSFRKACAILAVSRAFVGTEGGLHHAAAALGVPAVVIFGGFISPDITGYRMHRNLFTGGAACGMRTACEHCKEAMAAITPEMVYANLKVVLK